ncbi:ATP-dependent DNA helicase RecG [Patescibacteria group bacterium]|nr:ATP-dependent DNA helicase RecG [Patescibacteria group bacterium]
MAVHLSTPIHKLTRVGKVTSERLAKLGIQNVKDLLEHYPSRFEDYSEKLSLNQLAEHQIGSVFGVIKSIETKKTPRKKMQITECYLDDSKGTIKIIWFNQPYIAQTLREGDMISVAGKIEQDFNGFVIKNPNYEKALADEDFLHTSRLVPIYPATAGITQKQIRFLMHQALEAVDEFKDFLPGKIKEKARLSDKNTAIKKVHLPASSKEYLDSARRLKFEELFLIQLITEQSRKKLRAQNAPKIEFKEQATKNLVNSLPFKLTDDQRKQSWQILKDMQKKEPMNRLLQGEVGSGKTVVAAIAALNAAESGFQTALMAPTEILAFQHYETITNIFPDRPIALLTSKYARASTNPNASRAIIKKEISDGKIDIIIGTHAIIQKDINFNKLGLVIIDEQHRFGVEQRKALKCKNAPLGRLSLASTPHFLSMTATPIPRSLALTLYSDLDISSIRQMPFGRKPIQTKVVEEKNRPKAYEFIKQKISQGRQIFVICPLIEESDALGIKSATEEFEKLKKAVFSSISIGLLHGRMKHNEKERVMSEFKNNNISILVSTAVVEVGIDVPNASIMIIEGADRFGLAQLHQFRGRVGRSSEQSYCFLFTDSQNAQTKNRMQSFVNARDGFEIAELDLQLRGPGQIYGTAQSGRFEDLKIARLTDAGLISETKKYAQDLLDNDPNLGAHAQIKFEIEKRAQELHFE